MSADKFKTDKPRHSSTVVINCHAIESMFVPEFDDMPQDMQDWFEAGNSIPCHGGGHVGVWCRDCEFSSVEGTDNG